MSNLTKPPILDDTGQDILSALADIKRNLPQGGGSNGYAPTDATEATLADDDKVPFYDTSASGKRNSTWANIKTVLSNLFMVKGVDYVTAGQRSGMTLGAKSTAEGNYTEASGDYSHAEGNWTKASGYASHAEGAYTTASGHFSHAEGSGASSSFKSVASGDYSHVEGHFTTAQGDYSHAEGYCTNAYEAYQHVQGKYNESKSDTLFEIGNGTDDTNRKNVFEVTANGVRPVVIASDAVPITSGHNAIFRLWSNGMKSFMCQDASMPAASVVTGVVIPEKYRPTIDHVRGIGFDANYGASSTAINKARGYTVGTDGKIYLYQGSAVGFYASSFYI